MVENRQCSEDEEKYYILIKSFIVQIIFHAIFSMDDNQKMFLKQRGERNKGQYTEKRIHLSSRLPYWLQAVTPRVFYVVEKSWNFFPYTITEYTVSKTLIYYVAQGYPISGCSSKFHAIKDFKIIHHFLLQCSFLPKFRVEIYTKFEDNSGTTENTFQVPEEEYPQITIDHVDIAFDEIQPKHFKEEEDPKVFRSIKTNRGPLVEGWRVTDTPLMCSYKLVHASFEVWGFQTKVEDFIHKCIREVLLLEIGRAHV